MDYIGKDYQKKQIKKHQKFLLKLLHLHIGNYYPLRKWLGIDYKGKIDEITHLSIAYNAKKLKKGYQVTRTYQQPDLGYKLNLVLDKIPQLALLPALLQPAYGLGALAFFFLTQTTFQPSTADTYLSINAPDNNFGSSVDFRIQGVIYGLRNAIIYFDTSDIPDGVAFSQGDIELVCINVSGVYEATMNRMTRITWGEGTATYNKYDGVNPWTTVGGDYTDTNAVNIPVTTTGVKIWNAPTLIQDCYNNQSKKVFLLLHAKTGDSSATFASNNYATTTDRPKLTVTYEAVSANTTNFFQMF